MGAQGLLERRERMLLMRKEGEKRMSPPRYARVLMSQHWLHDVTSPVQQRGDKASGDPKHRAAAGDTDEI